ncbi:MAG: PorV/PorQ family protein [Bacteroidota bacterium]
MHTAPLRLPHGLLASLLRHIYAAGLVALTGLCLVPVQAQELSSLPGAFVNIGFGARPAALGNAYVALADDAQAIMWNPAGLAQSGRYGLAFSYIDHLGLVEYQHMAASIPLRTGGLGLAVHASGDEALQELVVLAGYARPLGDALKLGVNAKYRRASFGNNAMGDADLSIFDPGEVAEAMLNQVTGTASGFGFDVGLLYQATPKMRLGVTVRDAAAPVNWQSAVANTTNTAQGSYTEAVPLELAVGSAYRVSEQFLVTADYNPALSSELTNRLHVGVEAKLLSILALRGGMQQFVNGLSDEKYAVGFGLDIPFVQAARIMADYTYLVESLANTQHVSLSIAF